MWTSSVAGLEYQCWSSFQRDTLPIINNLIIKNLIEKQLLEYGAMWVDTGQVLLIHRDTRGTQSRVLATNSTVSTVENYR